jgi:hypothetical protein
VGDPLGNLAIADGQPKRGKKVEFCSSGNKSIAGWLLYRAANALICDDRIGTLKAV